MTSIPINDTENKTRSKHQFGLIFSHAAIGIVVTDSEGTIINFKNMPKNNSDMIKKKSWAKK